MNAYAIEAIKEMPISANESKMFLHGTLFVHLPDAKAHVEQLMKQQFSLFGLWDYETDMIFRAYIPFAVVDIARIRVVNLEGEFQMASKTINQHEVMKMLALILNTQVVGTKDGWEIQHRSLTARLDSANEDSVSFIFFYADGEFAGKWISKNRYFYPMHNETLASIYDAIEMFVSAYGHEA